MSANTKRIPNRIDWKSQRDRIDLPAVVTRFLGPAQGRRGEGGRKLWWVCPFHEDRNPSFSVEPGKPWWRCWGCGEHGDAATLLMRLDSLTFPEAVAFLTGHSSPSWKPPTRPAKRPSTKPPPEPSGLPEEVALALVEESSARLWKPEGSDALDYLTGPRGLSPETIKTARLGWTPETSVPNRDGDRFLHASGWVIPWFNDGRLAMVKIRQPDGCKPKYVEAYRNPGRLVCFPGPETVQPGRPLVVVEGELDALALGQALGDLAAVITLGSASARPDARTYEVMLAAPRWYVATDADDAGDKAAHGWPARSRRVRPPAPFKDWTDARAGLTLATYSGIDLRRWWSDIIDGDPNPPRFTWDELARQRWGPALESTPGRGEGGIEARG